MYWLVYPPEETGDKPLPETKIYWGDVCLYSGLRHCNTIFTLIHLQNAQEMIDGSNKSGHLESYYNTVHNTQRYSGTISLKQMVRPSMIHKWHVAVIGYHSLIPLSFRLTVYRHSENRTIAPVTMVYRETCITNVTMLAAVWNSVEEWNWYPFKDCRTMSDTKLTPLEHQTYLDYSILRRWWSYM